MKRCIILLFSVLFFSALHAQQPRLTVQLSNEQISLPFTSIAPIHPGLEIGYRKPVSPHREWQFHAGGFYHQGLYTGLYVRAAHAFNWQPQPWVQLQVAPGIGYLHTFTTQPLWSVNEAGTYEQVGRAGQPHALVEVGFNAIFLPNANISPMIGYRVALETPFATVFPIMFHNFLQAGVSISLPSNS